MKAIQGIKPQDILVLLKMTLDRDRSWRLVDLAQELGLSLSEVSMALERARRSGLIDSSKKRVLRQALEEFILHGLKYVCPAQPGPVCRGMPTAHSAPPIADRIVSNENDQYVWPDAEGELRGQAIEPLYGSVPAAARRDRNLYEMLALIDALRAGRARERNIAAEEIKNRLNGNLQKH
jgi:DNA-binding transcriptional MocR family regulator